jgi:predicted hydrocarbon binding protein
LKSNSEVVENSKGILRSNSGFRIVQLRSEALQLARRNLIGITSELVTRQLLFREGMSIGKSAYKTLKDNVSNDETFWTTLDAYAQRRGWGYLLSHEKTGSGFSYNIHIGNSALTDGPIMDHPPVCDILRGILGGWLSSFHNRSIDSVAEEQCASLGSSFCAFQVTLAQMLQQLPSQIHPKNIHITKNLAT